VQVVVVGAGLGGLAAAIAVRAAGHQVVVCERSPTLREAGAGIGLMPNGVLALDALGLGPRVRAMAMPLAGIEGGLRDYRGRLLLGTRQDRLAAALGAPVVVVPRRWLHRLLADALPDGVIRTSVDVQAVPAGGVVATSAGDLPADLVVGADGVGSGLRAWLFPTHPGVVGSGEYAARALVTVPAALGGRPLPAGELLDHRTGERFGCMPMASPDGRGLQGEVYWYATWPASADRGRDGLRDWLAHRRRDWHPAVGVLITAAAPADVHVDETVRLVAPLPALVAGRVALLGDAAHAMTPDLGQGGCQAFEDAVALGAVLAGVRDAGRNLDAALRRYDAVRRPRTATLIAASTRMNRLLTLTGPPARVRNLALRAVPPALATRALIRQLRMSPV
jgi:2-polyprenyl-6-methoxyphenol hydroxylase-like FAD-dependent oxidoreductase